MTGIRNDQKQTAYCPHCDHCNAGRVNGESIRKKRAELGIKQKELARELSISPTYLSDIENDRRPIRFSGRVGQRVVEYLGL